MSRISSLGLFLTSILAVVLAAASPVSGQYQPTSGNLEAREWFQDAKFGMFIHWGVYSLLQDGEWVMNNRGITVEQYETLPGQFHPVEFDAEEWVALAKSAGARYITITSKHHDGFAMFDSTATDWDIVDRSPYGKDVLAMLAEECHRQGIGLFFYYSQLDWHHPDYYPRGATGRESGRPDRGDWQQYLDFMDAQLGELLTYYGDIAGIWFDGMWDRPEVDWRLDRTYALIHELQPAALIGSNHHRRPYPGEDFQMFEKDLPGGNTAGFNTTEIGVLPLESCETINGSWGYNLTDRNQKNAADLIRLLVNAAGRNANLLLNVGPMPTGEIQQVQQQRLREMGVWLADHGEAIYGTRGGPIAPRPWGVTTRKGNQVYVHVLDWADPQLVLPPLPGEVRMARQLVGGENVSVRILEDGVLLTLPPRGADEIDQIVVLELAP